MSFDCFGFSIIVTWKDKSRKANLIDELRGGGFDVTNVYHFEEKVDFLALAKINDTRLGWHQCTDCEQTFPLREARVQQDKVDYALSEKKDGVTTFTRRTGYTGMQGGTKCAIRQAGIIDSEDSIVWNFL